MKKKAYRLAAFLLTCILLLNCMACSQGEVGSVEAAAAPKCLTAEFNGDKATGTDVGAVDFSSLSNGYVAVKAEGKVKLKFQMIKGGETYTYDLPSGGGVAIFPVNMGNGSYEFRLMKQVEGTKYAKAWSATKSVTLKDEFQPYLRPNQISNYNPGSACVTKAAELAKKCRNDLETAGAVYEFLAKEIKYDKAKAKTVKDGYIPNPDSTLSSKKGICFDYAALAAAMLRSQGIPCQVVTGYVGDKELYHAWNRIYIKNKGWLTVGIKVNKSDWKRVDITFAASGTPTKELENDKRYTTRFVY